MSPCLTPSRLWSSHQTTKFFGQYHQLFPGALWESLTDHRTIGPWHAAVARALPPKYRTLRRWPLLELPRNAHSFHDLQPLSERWLGYHTHQT